MNIIVTGATGYVGKALLSSLSKCKGYKLYAICRKKNDFSNGIEIIIDDEDFETNVINANPQLVIHLASFLTPNSTTEDIIKLIDSNILFGTKLLSALSKTKLQYFINVGSFSEYHYNDTTLNPTYLYSATKTAFRSIVKYYSETFKFKCINVVPFTIYGGEVKNKKVLDILFDSLNEEHSIQMSDGHQSLDFIHINDVVDFFRILIPRTKDLPNEAVFHLGTGLSYTLRQIADMIRMITNRDLNIKWGCAKSRERDTIYACADLSNSIRLLNWRPKILIDEGIGMMYVEKQGKKLV